MPVSDCIDLWMAVQMVCFYYLFKVENLDFVCTWAGTIVFFWRHPVSRGCAPSLSLGCREKSTNLLFDQLRPKSGAFPSLINTNHTNPHALHRTNLFVTRPGHVPPRRVRTRSLPTGDMVNMPLTPRFQGRQPISFSKSLR